MYIHEAKRFEFLKKKPCRMRKLLFQLAAPMHISVNSEISSIY